MTPYEFRCDLSADVLVVEMPMVEAPSLGEWTACICDEASEHEHEMRRIISRSVFATEVKGTGNGKIGRGLEDRAELGRRRRATWK